jgi:MarR family transcriptional regulator, lower aerobic nicotinate degradation pathway regulator
VKPKVSDSRMSDASATPSLNESAIRPSQDARRAMDSLRRLVHALRSATRASEKSVGLSAAQHFVLRQLESSSGVSPSELASCAHTSASSISEVIARLVARGLVSRVASISDRRRVELRLTAAGADLLASAPQTVQERLLAGLERLSSTDRLALVNGLESWITASDLGDTQPVLFFEDEPHSGVG